uniref:Uncharacterized protein n=1 Tax=Trypanosoma congolense (strain IL3000) TaxID=1068625 RepID=G0UX51_TRYCI|nr:conserved hypothetical protein [Trypanosoma congolense IL3000]
MQVLFHLCNSFSVCPATSVRQFFLLIRTQMKGSVCHYLRYYPKCLFLHTRLLSQQRRKMSDPTDSHEAIVRRVSKETLCDIEGLDPSKFGFERGECCGPIPTNLPGSLKLVEHLFLASDLSPKEWESNLGNVTGYNELSAKVGKSRDIQLTVFHRPGPDELIMRFLYDESLESLTISQYSCITPGEFPWESDGSVCCDRTGDTFVFVCAHHLRDSRCGYCGTVLVDLLKTAIDARNSDNHSIYVYPCSHVGGHMYAGNVLVYTARGGLCFGRVRPSDVECLVDFLMSDDYVIPKSLEPRVRGKVGFVQKSLNCHVM